mmetsp:Transcript_39893/g.96299  ORF Transcript_39893/g.96299 Transcript_39893/m.96299 type:complete len:210 (-) Transcript_39893:498-1127(-)
MLHVLQYLYPTGPPSGTHSGMGALTGLETGGMIPGSINAETHNVVRLVTAMATLHQNILCVLQLKRPTASICSNLGITTRKWNMYPTTMRIFVKTSDGASLPNMHLPRHKNAWFPIHPSVAVNSSAKAKPEKCCCGNFFRAQPDRPPTLTSIQFPLSSVPWDGTTADRRKRPVTPDVIAEPVPGPDDDPPGPGFLCSATIGVIGVALNR